MLTFLKNNLIFRNKYKSDPAAIIISCFFNPKNSPYRLSAFKTFYDSIKHMDHRIAECIIGDTEPQLEKNPNIIRVYTKDLLWHKETLLNLLIKDLPAKYKYIFWIDADVIFSNPRWLVEGTDLLRRRANIIQPFEYCMHLDKDQTEPSYEMSESILLNEDDPHSVNSKVWRSFCSNYTLNDLWQDEKYDSHGHVGFAWGAKREILDTVPLYDRALIGGADHIIAHAAAGQIHHKCIEKAFTENMEEIDNWSNDFYYMVKGRIDYVPGELYHIWHGDIDKRQYLKRIKDFTPSSKNITQKDQNGLYVSSNRQQKEYIDHYFSTREVTDDNFLLSVAAGYAFDNAGLGAMVGGNFAGAIIGDMLNSDNNSQILNEEIKSDIVPADSIQNSVPTDSIPDNSIDSTDNENFS